MKHPNNIKDLSLYKGIVKTNDLKANLSKFDKAVMQQWEDLKLHKSCATFRAEVEELKATYNIGGCRT